ncbi:MAG TPA: hypothetical protein VFM29_07880, partial [Vicinamibacteria bacterium]|nr:hypothetical protein [Vicinamibacteria bacterium]
GDVFTGSIEVVGRDKRRWTLAQGLFFSRGLAWHPGGDEVWFSALAGHGSSEIRAATLSGRDRVIARVPGWAQLRDVFRDGRALLSRHSVRTSTIVGGEGVAERDLSWHDSSSLADLSADARTVLFNETVFGGGGEWGVYVRRTDGSPAVRLGEGYFGWALSPDGRWVLANRRRGRPAFVLLPTGAGEARPLDVEAGSGFRGASWFPDSTRIAMVRAVEEGGAQLFVQDVSGGPLQPTAVKGEDLRWPLVSPDGRSAAAVGDDGGLWVFSLADGTGRPFPDAEPADVPLQWSADGQALYVYSPSEQPSRIFTVRIGGGRRLWKVLAPPDPIGLGSHSSVALSRDATAWAYSFTHSFGELYLVEGLR